MKPSLGKLTPLLLAGAIILSTSQKLYPQSEEKEETKADEETVFYGDPGVNYLERMHKGIMVRIEKPGYDSLAMIGADVLAEINQNMAPGGGILEYRLRWQDTSDSEMPKLTGMCYSDQTVFGLLSVLGISDRVRMSPTHEGAHRHFESGEVDTAVINGIYNRMEEKTKGCDKETSRLWMMFDESHYVKGSPQSYGHLDDPSEFYSSATANLKGKPMQVIAGMDKLWENSRDYYYLAYEAFRKVITQWKTRFFSPEIYQKFGLD